MGRVSSAARQREFNGETTHVEGSRQASEDPGAIPGASTFSLGTLIRTLRHILPIVLLFAAGCAGPRSAATGVVEPTRIGGLDYVPLQSLCERTQAACQWDRPAKTVTVQLGPLRMAGREQSPQVTVNGIPQRLSGPIVVYRGALMVPRTLEEWLTRLGVPPAAPAPAAGTNAIRRIILDPGHGGHDPGAIGAAGVREKDVTLDIARRLRQQLVARGVEVLMTREDDTFVSLGARTRMAAERQADLFLSIHANASRNKRVHGVEAYYLREAQDGSAWAWSAAGEFQPPVAPGVLAGGDRTLHAILWDLLHAERRRQAVELGMRLCRTLREQLQLRSRGVRGARFHVLRTATMPAVLLEVGYLTNAAEGSRLGDPAFRESLAAAIAQGTLHYVQQYAQSNGFAR